MHPNTKCFLAVMVLFSLFWSGGCSNERTSDTQSGGVLDNLARPQTGRSMRATSAMRVGELRRVPTATAMPESGDMILRPLHGGIPTSAATGTTSMFPGRHPCPARHKGSGRYHSHLDHLSRAGTSRLGDPRARPTTRSFCCGCSGMEIPSRRWRLRSEIFLPTASGGAAKSSACLSSSRAETPTILLAHALPRIRPDRDRKPEPEAPQPSLLSTSTGSNGHAAEGHALLLRAVSAGISCSQRPGLCFSGNNRQGTFRRRGSGRSDAQPGLVRRGGRKDLHRRRRRPLDLGYGNRRLLSVGLGASDYQHALFWSAVFRLPDAWRARQLLPLASKRSHCLQHRD